MRMPRMQLCTQRPQKQSQRSCLSYRDRRLLELRHDKKERRTLRNQGHPRAKAQGVLRGCDGASRPLTRRSLRSGLSALPSADSVMLNRLPGRYDKGFDWVSTGHQECWTPEARERKRQMMLKGGQNRNAKGNEGSRHAGPLYRVPISAPRKRRVAAPGSPLTTREQLTSYEAQVDYYKLHQRPRRLGVLRRIHR